MEKGSLMKKNTGLGMSIASLWLGVGF